MIDLNCLAVAEAAQLKKGKPNGSEHYFCCPFHDDKEPSLRIHAEKNTWYCDPCHKGGTAWELAAGASGLSPGDKTAVSGWLRERGLLNGNGSQGATASKIAAEYDYRDENGNLLFQTIRLIPKDFRQRHPDDNGAWIWNLKGVRLAPYRLNEWKDKQCVWIVEGEKDADALWSLGIPATCNPLGAGKWRKEYDLHFSGKSVAILRDNDEPGKKHGQAVARHLFPVAKAVKMIDLPDLPPKGDVSDWIARGGTRDELRNIIHGISPLTNSDVDAWEDRTQEGEEPERFRYESVSAIPAVHEIPHVDIEFVVHGILPKNSVTVFAAVPGGMKSYLALDISRKVAAGEPFAGRKTLAMPVLYLDRENPDTVLRERLTYLGVLYAPELRYWGGWLPEWPPHLGDPRVIDWAKKTKGLVVVDSLIRFSPAKDENDSAEMARVMESLRCLQRFGATVLVLHHASEKSAYSYRGSSEILGGCDELYNLRKVDDYTVELTWKEKTRFGVDKDVALKRVKGGFIATQVQPREDAELSEAAILDAMLELITANPGLSKTALVDLAAPRGIGQKEARAALAKLENDPRVRVEDGKRGATLFFLALDPVEEAAF